LKGGIFQPAGSTPEPYKDFLSINEERLWLVKPPGPFLQMKSRLTGGERRGEGAA